IDVMSAGLRSELHFLELAGGVLLARCLRLLLLGVLVLSVVHDPAHRRARRGGDLHPGELLLIGDALGLQRRPHAQRRPIAVDHANLGGTDLLVDADSLFDLRYKAPPGIRASRATWVRKASRPSAGRSSPPTRGATVPSAASRSPTTASTGI